MKVTRTVVLFALLAAIAYGHCVLPSEFCSRLNPGMVVFVGKPISLVDGKYDLATVTFEIQERLWGLTNESLAKVSFYGGYMDRGPRFLAVTPRGDGTFYSDYCGGGLALPLDHPWVAEFRRNLAERRPATIPVLLRSFPGYVNIGGADIQLRGNGLEFTSKSRTRADLTGEFQHVPPGTYTFSAVRKYFTQPDGKEPISILPGSCAEFKVYLKPSSGVVGRVVDARGAPVGDTEILLDGAADPRVLDESIFDTVLGSIHGAFYRLTGWGKQPEGWPRSSGVFKTDRNGQFMGNVVPGRYYLSVLPSRSGGYADIPLPSAYYPGVYGSGNATALVVEEGKMLEHVLFRLPDFGEKRRVEIRVVSEDGVPVSGAVVQDGGRDGYDKTANTGAQQTADTQGRAVYRLWSGCDYYFRAAYYPPQRSNPWQSYDAEVLELPAGANPVSRTMVIKGLRMRKVQ